MRDIDNCDVSFTPGHVIFVILQTLKSVGVMTGTSILPYVISARGTHRRCQTNALVSLSTMG